MSVETKIAALLAKASGTDNEAEAAAFAAKAAELLQKYNLDLSAIERAAHKTGEEVGTVKLDLRYTDPWRTAIVRSTAELYFCRVYFNLVIEKNAAGSYEQRKKYVLVGKPHNTAVAVSMIDYLLSTTLRLARDFSTDRAQRLGFERGCGERIAQRLRTMKSDAEKESALPGGNLPALYRTEDELVLAKMETLGLRRGRRSRGSDLSGFAAQMGRSAGDSVSLQGQVKTARSAGAIGHG